MIKVTQKGSFDNTERFLNKNVRGNIFSKLEKYGAMGVSALSAATPIDSGETAKAWSYTIVQRNGYFSVRWTNSHINEGRPIAILLQYGHGTRQGGYVQGRDYIMPAIRPIFAQMATEAWKEVTG